MMEPAIRLENTTDTKPTSTIFNHYAPIYVRCGAHVTHLVTSRATQTSTDVGNALSSVKELDTSYTNSGKLKCLYW